MIMSIVFAAALLQLTPDAASDVKNPPVEKRVCKREKLVGSMVRARKVCRSKAEWDAEQSNSQQNVRDMQNKPSAPPNV